MKFLGTKNLHYSDLAEILFKNDAICIDLSLDPIFLKDEKTTQLSLVDIQDRIKQMAMNFSPEIALKDYNLPLFNRAFLFLVLVHLLRQKKQIRKCTVELLAKIINKAYKLENFLLSPYHVIMVFYGECGLGNQLESLSEIKCLTQNEFEIIFKIVEKCYNFSLLLVNLNNLKELLTLNCVGFSLSLEQNSISNDFLALYSERKSLTRMISEVSETVLSVIVGTKFNKSVPNQYYLAFIELLAACRSYWKLTVEFIAEELNVEETEGTANLKFNSDNIEKNFHSLNVLVQSLLSTVSALSTNALQRLRGLKELGAPAIEDNINKIEKEVINCSSMPLALVGAHPKAFGNAFLISFSVHALVKQLEELNCIESFLALNYLEALHHKINPPAKETTEEKKADEKTQKKEAAAKKLQAGKGSLHLLHLYLDFLQKPQETPLDKLEKKLEAFKNGFFSLRNREFMHEVSELISAKNEERRKPKLPKGTRDFTPHQMALRKKAFKIITDVFLKHGAVEIDTPVFELKETLTGKYGEDSKLIYDLQDQGGELLSLRYDLTVPFARYLALKNISNIKRYHIAKVYRRDNPALSKGRFREFYQCDFDIAGNYDLMLPDAEVIKVVDEILTNLGLGNFVLKVNNRKLLDAMVELSGAPKQKFKQICSSIDKLDKEPWSEVRRELIEEKGLTAAVADKLGFFVSLNGNPKELLEKIQKEQIFSASETGKKAVSEMEVLFNYLEAINGLTHVSFELSLARGLDYYTGVIFEAVLIGAQVGSISGGGRYDELVGMFSGKQIPAVGVSIGIERVFNILEEKAKNDSQIRQNQTEVMVATIGGGMLHHKLKLINELWEHQIKTEMIYNEKPKPQKQLGYALENQIPFILWIGEDEMKKNVVNVKCLYTGHSEEMNRGEIVNGIKKKIEEYYRDLEAGKVLFLKPETGEEEKEKEKEDEGKKKGKKK